MPTARLELPTIVTPLCIIVFLFLLIFFFSSIRRHTRSLRDWSSDVCSSDLRPVHRRRTSSCNQARPGRWPSRSARGPAASWLSPAVGRCVARTVRQQPRSLALGARRWRRPRPGRRAGRSGSRRGRRRRAGRGGRSPVGADRWLGKDARMLPGSGKDVRITPLRVSVRSLYGLTMTTTPRSAPTLAPAFDLDRFLQLPRVSGLALAPDGRRLVAAVATAAPDGKRFVTALWELDPDGERPPRRLTLSASGYGGHRDLPSVPTRRR